MELKLIRRWLTDKSSVGELYVDGQRVAYTLEDETRPPGEKVLGETAIPLGRYEVRITHSPRFGIDMPMLLDVPGFAGVRIHWGNTAADTEGCILVGLDRGPDQVLRSKLAYQALFERLAAAQGPIFITVAVETPQGATT